jgi:hypothetical protein
MNRWHIALVFALVVGLAAGAAEPIQMDLGLFKLTSAAKGGDDLVKYENDTLNFYANGTATGKLTVPADGEYVIVIEASGNAALKENPKFTLKVGDAVVKEKFELTTEDKKEYEFEAKLTKGETTLSIAYVNDVYKENEYDRNLFVHGVKVKKK